MWRRHCKALLRKQVLPLLYSPLPMVSEMGHEVSTPPGYREALLKFDGAVSAFKDFRGGGAGKSGRCRKSLKGARKKWNEALTFGLTAFGDPFIGSYLPGGTASAPDEEPSTNSMGGGSRLLKASLSLDGRYCSESSGVKGGCMGKSGDASIIDCNDRLSVEQNGAREKGACRAVNRTTARASCRARESRSPSIKSDFNFCKSLFVPVKRSTRISYSLSVSVRIL